MNHMIEVKRGDTLSFIVIRKDELGNPLTGDAVNLKAQIRDGDDILYGEFVITELPTAGEYLFTVDAQITKDFTIGRLYFDIEYKDNNVVYSTETMIINVVMDVTR